MNITDYIGWRPLIFKGIQTKYFVDTFGNIYQDKETAKRTGAEMAKIYTNSKGYKVAILQINNQRKYVYVHRAMAESFIPNPKEYPLVNHIDGDKSNNYITNLEWTTYKYNSEHAIEHELFDPRSTVNKVRGEKVWTNKYPEQLIHEVCKLLEQNVGPSEIARRLPITYINVMGIKRGHSWTHISRQYNIPKCNTPKKLSSELHTAIIYLTMQSYGVKDIIRILNLDPSMYTHIDWIRKSYRRLSQLEGSTTIDPFISIDESLADKRQ